MFPRPKAIVVICDMCLSVSLLGLFQDDRYSVNQYYYYFKVDRLIPANDLINGVVHQWPWHTVKVKCGHYGMCISGFQMTILHPINIFSFKINMGCISTVSDGMAHQWPWPIVKVTGMTVDIASILVGAYSTML